MAVSLFASGALIKTQGWSWLNQGSLVPITLVSLALLWLAWSGWQQRSRTWLTLGIYFLDRSPATD